MALNLTNLMTALGENIKKIDIFNTLITSLETYKDDIYTDLAAGGFQDQYTPYPAQFLSMKNSVASWISTLKSNCTNILLDTELVLDELPIYSFDITSVLNGLYDYMEDNSQTIETSVVTLAGSDVAKNSAAGIIAGISDSIVVETHAIFAEDRVPPALFVSRTLDGTSAPGNGVTAHTRYDGQESQLARTGTIYAELLSNTTIGSETARLYSELPASGSYLAIAESPGPGPTLTNPEANNKITSNAKFDTWVGDAPTGWTMSGTVTTDYEDGSSTGAGPLYLNTQGITALKQISNLAHSTLYFLAAAVHHVTQGDADEDVVGIKLRTLGDSEIVSQATASLDLANNQSYAIVYNFFRLPTTVDLTDVYVELEYVTAGHANGVVAVSKVVCSPVNYYNGLAWVWWPSYHVASNKSFVPAGHLTTLAVSNNNNGKFQTFFRRAYNVQLPTADAPTVNDALAGG